MRNSYKLLTALMLTMLTALHGCATTEELYAQYDAKLCRIPTPVGITMGTVTAVSGFPWHIAVYFGLDEDYLTDESNRRLKINMQTLTDHPELRVLIRGFTDSIASKEYNLDLSERRVHNVVSHLDAKGLKAHRITIQPNFGEEFAVEPNTTEDRRAMNRRVEMLLMDEDGRIMSVNFDGNEPQTPE